jgi:hypothetical protein
MAKGGKGVPEKKFRALLKKMVAEIRENARGITCEDCPFSTLFPGGTGYCHRFVDEYTGEFLRTSSKAPACDHHPRLAELKLSIETAREAVEGCDSRSDNPPSTETIAPSQEGQQSPSEAPRSDSAVEEEAGVPELQQTAELPG